MGNKITKMRVCLVNCLINKNVIQDLTWFLLPGSNMYHVIQLSKFLYSYLKTKKIILYSDQLFKINN